MRFDPRWIVVDLTDRHFSHSTDPMIISADNVPVEKGLRRAITSRRNGAAALDMDRDGAAAFGSYVAGLDSTNPVDASFTRDGLHVAHIFHTHPTFEALSVSVWMHEKPPTEPPIVNQWVVNLDGLYSATAGDDLPTYGDGRKEGETRPLQDIWRYLDPADAVAIVQGYSSTIDQPAGTWMSVEWSLLLPDQPAVHLFSGGRLFEQHGQRILAGSSIKPDSRTRLRSEIMGPLAQFTSSTLVLVNWSWPGAITSLGADAPLSNEALETIMQNRELIDGETKTLQIEGRNYAAQSLPITDDPSDAALVMLRRT